MRSLGIFSRVAGPGRPAAGTGVPVALSPPSAALASAASRALGDYFEGVTGPSRAGAPGEPSAPRRRALCSQVDVAENQSPANPGRLAAADGGEAILRVSDRHRRFRFDPAGVVFGASEDYVQLRQALDDPGFSAAPVDSFDRGLEADLAGEGAAPLPGRWSQTWSSRPAKRSLVIGGCQRRAVVAAAEPPPSCCKFCKTCCIV